MARDEFSQDVKDRLAARAGYLCSICGAATVGPSNESTLAVNLTGVAAHISAASPNKPARRYEPLLSKEVRRSIDNGIWLCATHADLIDGDESTYTIYSLKIVKENHERKVALRQKGVAVERGVLTKLELGNFGSIRNSIVLEFSDRNIITGDNGAGKTLLMDMIAALNDRVYLNRWTETRLNHGNSFCNIYYFQEREYKYSLTIDHRNKVSYHFNGQEFPFLKLPAKIVFLDKSFSDYKQTLSEDARNNTSIVKLLAGYFGLQESEFIVVTNSIMRTRKFFFVDLIVTENLDLSIKIGRQQRDSFHSFAALSGGEKQRVILEMALKIAEFYSKFGSTILLIEHTSFDTIDVAGVDQLLHFIKSENVHFQFFFTTMEKHRYNTEGFKRYDLLEVEQEGIRANEIAN
jgi:AAA domain